MTGALWAEVMPDALAVRTASDRTFGELNARCNQLVRALRARGVRPGDGVALLCSNRPEFVEVFAASRAPACASRRSTGTSPATRPATSSTTARRRRSSPTPRFARRRPRAPPTVAPRLRASHRGRRRRSTASRTATSVLAREDGARHRRPDARHARCSTRRARPAGRRACAGRARPRGARSTSRGSPTYRAGQHVHLCTGPLYHAAPLAFSLGVAAAFGVAVVMMDGWTAERTLALDRGARRHAHAHGADDVPPPARRCPTR